MNGSDELRRENVNSEEMQEKLYRKVRRRNRMIVLTCVLIALLILLTVGWICMKMFFTVDEIEVVCGNAYDASEILSASGLRKGEVIFFISSSEVRNRVLEDFPLLENVKLRKEYPNKLIFETVEEVPLFYYYTGSEDTGYAVVARSQKLLALCRTEEEVRASFGALLLVDMPAVKYAVIGDKLGYFEKGDSIYIPELLVSLEKFNLGAEPVLLNAVSRFDLILYCGQSRQGRPKYEILLGNKDQLEDKLSFAEGIIEQLGEDFEGIVSVEDPKNGYARRYKDL